MKIITRNVLITVEKEVNVFEFNDKDHRKGQCVCNKAKIVMSRGR